MEFCVTINPDPKKKHGKKQWYCLSPRRQYVLLEYFIRDAIRSKLRSKVANYKFIFEIGSNGCLHSHGSIVLLDVSGNESNTHKMALKSFQLMIVDRLGRNTNSQFLVNACCDIKPRNDNVSVDARYQTWDEYLAKHKKDIPKWMIPIEKGDNYDIFELYNNMQTITTKDFLTHDLDN